MKIELLKNGFGSTMEREAPTAAIVPRKRRHLPTAAGHLDDVSPAPGVREEALLAIAAEVFDPRRLTRDEFEALVEIMHDGGQITCGERDVFAARLSRSGDAGYGLSNDAAADMLSVLRIRADESVAEMKLFLVLESLAEHRRLAA